MTWLVNLGDTAVTFHRQTHAFATGAVSSADALPEFSVYQGTATAAIVSATMAAMGSTGFYRGTFTCVSSTGFVAGLYGSVHVVATVSSVKAAAVIPFQIVPTTLARIGVRLISASSDGSTAVQAGMATTAQLNAVSTAAQAALQVWSSGIQSSLLTDIRAQSTAIMADTRTVSTGAQAAIQVWTSAIQTVLLADVRAQSTAIMAWSSGTQTAILTRVSSESSGLKTWSSGMQTVILTDSLAQSTAIMADTRLVSTAAQAALQVWTSAIQTAVIADSFAQSTAMMADTRSVSTAAQAALQIWSSGIQTAVLADVKAQSTAIMADLRSVSTAAQASIESTIGPRVAAIVGTDPAGMPASAATWISKLDWVYNYFTSRQTFDRVTGIGTIYNASTIAVTTFDASDDATTFVRQKASS